MLISSKRVPNQYREVSSGCSKEPVIITKNGKVVAKLTGVEEDRIAIARSLFGILPKDVSLEKAREERLRKREGTH